MRRGWLRLLASAAVVMVTLVIGSRNARSQGADPPASPVKLVFIHHSCGENWLNNASVGDQAGELGIALRDSSYYVSDTNYGWDAPYNTDIGSTTDIGHWHTWFADTTVQGNGQARRDNIAGALYTEYGQNCFYSRLPDDPGGENVIIMFKSCFPNSNLRGSPGDPPTGGANPLRGQDCYREDHSVANAKGIYNDILAYFETRPDKLFVVITAPPVRNGAYASNARGFNDWLVNDWLNDYNGGAGYPYRNVAVFDFYNLLTSNGGATRTSFSDYGTNDLAWVDGNHHRWSGGAAQHLQTISNDVSAYPSWGSDDHPYGAGNLKATGEFVSLLNYFYNRWRDDGGFPVRLNFQPAASLIPAGYRRDDGSAYGSHGSYNYGWN